MFSIVVFGDSITFGVADDKNKRGWVGRLQEYFESKSNHNVLYNLGIPGGKTLENILVRFDVECTARRSSIYPDDRFAIIIATGINDSKTIGSKTNMQIKEDKFEENLKLLINKAKNYTREIFFVGPTPVDETLNPLDGSYVLNGNIEQYSRILKKICEKKRIHYIDLFKKWKNIKYKRLLADKLHPNSKGYELIFQEVKRVLIKHNVLV